MLVPFQDPVSSQRSPLTQLCAVGLSGLPCRQGRPKSRGWVVSAPCTVVPAWVLRRPCMLPRCRRRRHVSCTPAALWEARKAKKRRTRCIATVQLPVPLVDSLAYCSRGCRARQGQAKTAPQKKGPGGWRRVCVGSPLRPGPDALQHPCCHHATVGATHCLGRKRAPFCSRQP